MSCPSETPLRPGLVKHLLLGLQPTWHLPSCLQLVSTTSDLPCPLSHCSFQSDKIMICSFNSPRSVSFLLLCCFISSSLIPPVAVYVHMNFLQRTKNLSFIEDGYAQEYRILNSPHQVTGEFVTAACGKQTRMTKDCVPGKHTAPWRTAAGGDPGPCSSSASLLWQWHREEDSTGKPSLFLSRVGHEKGIPTLRG